MYTILFQNETTLILGGDGDIKTYELKPPVKVNTDIVRLQAEEKVYYTTLYDKPMYEDIYLENFMVQTQKEKISLFVGYSKYNRQWFLHKEIINE